MQGLKSKTWVMVCDGKKAIYLENTGTASEPKLEVRQVHAHDDAASRDLNTDAAGRTSNADGRHASMDDGDAHDLQEQRFLKAVTERLEKFHAKFAFKDLIVVAPARALGVVRKALPHALQSLVRAEIEKDLVNMSIPDITRHLQHDLQPA